MLLSERQARLSHIVIEVFGEGRIVRVEAALLDDIASKPRSQALLLEIFELALDPTPSRD